MKNNALKILPILAISVSASAVEPGNGYAGISISKFGYDATIGRNGDDYSVEAEPEAFIVRLGYQLSDIVSIEARYGAGTSDDSASLDDEKTNADIGIDTYYGAFIRAHLPNKTTVSPYFIVGYNKIEIEIEGAGVGTSDDDTDLATGLGADFAFGSFSLNVEYLQVYDKTTVGGDALSFGATFQF